MFFKKSYHHNTYNRDDDGAFKILVGLNKYEDVYSDWDPSPFRRRDIEEDFIDFIWDSALDIPFDENMKIVFLIKENLRDEKKEMQLLKALKNHFKYSLNKIERQYFNEKKKSIKYFIIGIFLAVLVYSNVFNGGEMWKKIFEEGIVIGSWVFFWEAFYNIFMECQSIRHEIKLINKFLNTDFIFENEK